MAVLIWQFGSKRRQHKRADECMAIGYKEIQKKFGRTGFASMNDALGIFEVTPNWSVEYSETKGYKLTEKVKTIKDGYLIPDVNHTTNMLYSDNSGKFKLLKTLLEPIASRENDDPVAVSATAWRGMKVQNRTPVCIPSLMFLHKCLNDARNAALWDQDSLNEYEIGRVSKIIDAVGKLTKYAQTNVAGHGYVAIRYAECSTGRLYAQGTSLQTMPRIVRNTALHGLYDYDIENCNFTIFEQIAARYGYQADAIKYYLENKADVRRSIASRTDITVDQAKMCLLAILLGAKMTLRTDNAIPREIGVIKAERLYSDWQFKAIAEDASNGRDVILDAWPKGRSTLTNDLGKRISMKEKPETILAHLLQGVEAKAIRSAIDLYPNEIVLLMHDGFVSTRDIDIDLVERKMFTETGYKFSLSGRQIMSFTSPYFPN